MTKRLFDFIVAFAALALLAIPIVIVAIAVKLSSRGPVLYWSDRVGRGNTIFRMPKFRSMRIDTPVVATHLLESPGRWLTPVGGFLRSTSLDELPQLWSILVGHMSLVGPRPALHNQHDLIELRARRGVHVLRPGLTGWAQVNGRDEIPIAQKVEYDAYYLQHRSFGFDLRILALTFVKVARREGVAH
jgi:O-antigen biosynthesis protein WbqP